MSLALDLLALGVRNRDDEPSVRRNEQTALRNAQELVVAQLRLGLLQGRLRLFPIATGRAEVGRWPPRTSVDDPLAAMRAELEGKLRAGAGGKDAEDARGALALVNALDALAAESEPPTR